MGFLDKHIPVLEGENAERFLEKANKNEEGDKIDFSKQIELYEKIIKKSHIGETDMVNKQEFIDKAREILKNAIVDDVFANRGSVIKYMSVNEFIEYFCKAMEE